MTTTPTVRGVLRPDRTDNLRYFTPALCLLSLEDTAWIAGVSNPSRAACRAAPHTGDVRPMCRVPQSRTGCRLLPRQAGSPCPSYPAAPDPIVRSGAVRRGGARRCLPSTVELPRCFAAGRSRGMVRRGDRTRTCSLRFWRPLLFQLSYTPRCRAIQRKRRPVPVRVGGISAG
jgi:hypothetical protein